MSTDSPRKILVVGATGKQGSSFLRAALAPDANSDFHFVALTRDTQSRAAQQVKALGERVSVVAANLDKPETLRKVFEEEKERGGFYGMFVVLAFPGLGEDGAGEERQGKLCADLALEFGVQHYVYSSGERAHESRDEQMTQSRLAKVHIEKHIMSLQSLRWTILKPAFFMENFGGAVGRITATVMRVGLKKDTKLQLIAAEDIGHIAFAVMREPDQHIGETIVVIGDALTSQGMQDSYQSGAGRALPSVPGPLGRVLIAMNKYAKGVVNDVELAHSDRITHNISYDDLIARCRAIYPGMLTFEAWAKTRGVSTDRTKRWNNVTVTELAAGKR